MCAIVKVVSALDKPLPCPSVTTGVPSAGVRAHGLPGLVMPTGFGQLPTPGSLPSLGLQVPVMSAGLVSSTAASSSSSSSTAVAEGVLGGTYVRA